jgi:hypothetical protein
VTYERTDSGSNIDTIEQNTTAYTDGGHRAAHPPAAAMAPAWLRLSKALAA